MKCPSSTSFGFASDDWDDLRQDLALDCLRRLPHFDARRGDWQGFVRGVVRNQCCVLAQRQLRRRDLQSVSRDDNERFSEESCEVAHPSIVEYPFPVFELRLDVQRVLARLPEELQIIAGYLAEMSFFAVSCQVGLTHAQLKRKVAKIRAAFVTAGLAPSGRSRNGGQR